MMNRKRLAVILSNFNHARYLPESLGSLLRQTRKADEIIVIDDASSDNSVDLLNDYASRHPEIRLICNKNNRGYLANAQSALNLMESEYFFAASADDIYLPDFFQKSMALLEAHADAGLCSALSLVLKQEGGTPVLFPSPVVSMTASYLDPEHAAQALIKYGSWLMGNTAIYNKRIYLESGGYDVIQDLASLADGFMMEIIACRSGACFIPEPTGIWRRTAKGWSDSIVDNADNASLIALRAMTLMRERFRNYVPEAYPELWERDFRFSLEKKVMRKRRAAHKLAEMQTGAINKYYYDIRFLLDYLYLVIRHRPMKVIRGYMSFAAFLVYYKLRNL